MRTEEEIRKELEEWKESLSYVEANPDTFRQIPNIQGNHKLVISWLKWVLNEEE